MFTRPIEGTTVEIIEGPHEGKVGHIRTANTQVGMVRVYIDGFGTGSELLHLPTEFVKIIGKPRE